MTGASRSPSRVEQRKRRYLLGALGVFACILGLSLVLFRLPYLDNNSGDFKQDYYAARQFLAGESIYSSLERPNNHPPVVALLFIPWALLPYHQSILLWTGLSICLFFLTGWIVLHELRIKLRAEWLLILAGMSLCWYPFQTHLALGQLSILISALIISAWAFLRQRRETSAGVLLGLSTLIKFFPGLIILYLLFFKRWRALLSMLGVLSAGQLLALAFVGKEDFLRFIIEVSPSNAQKYIPFPGNLSLSGVFARLFADGPWVKPLLNLPQAASIFTLLASLCVLIVLVVQMRRLSALQAGSDAAFALNILGMLLVSPLTWQHIFPVLALPLGILLARSQTASHLPSQRILLLVILMISLPDFEIGRALMAWYAPYRMSWYAALTFNIPTFSLFIIWQQVGLNKVENHKQTH